MIPPHKLLLPELVSWLGNPDGERSRALLTSWSPETWQSVQRLVFMQGVGPYLHTHLPGTEVYPWLPAEFQEYLAWQHEQNAARVQRMLAELQAILAAAERLGLPVLVFKGGLLAGSGLVNPALRPMADLDLLIWPADRGAVSELMIELDYKLQPPDSRFSWHDQFLPRGSRIVSWTGEHPDNPRPVEVHWSLERSIWGGFPAPDFTRPFWESAQCGSLLGQKAWLPDLEIHYAYLALHALTHFIFRSGRLVHWLDLARLAPTAGSLSRLPYPHLLYPPLCQASRALPGSIPAADLAALAEQVPLPVRRWAERVPLDQCSGLASQFPGRFPALDRMQKRWVRWHPSLLRLALVYPRQPAGIALLHYLARPLRLAAHVLTRNKGAALELGD